MSWNQGGGGGPWGGGQSPWGRGPQQPKLDDVIRRGQDRIRRLLPAGGGSNGPFLIIALVVLVAVWAATGFYRVEPDEQGIVLHFGAYSATAAPGLNYHLPWPIETAQTLSVTRVNRIDIGYRVDVAESRGTSRADLELESFMLTGDQNVVVANFTVFWAIKDAKDYLFNLQSPDETVKVAAESAMREIMGRIDVTTALTIGVSKIEIDTQQRLQDILDSYKSGIQVTSIQLPRTEPPPRVNDAFVDMTNAELERQTAIKQAEAYCNNVVTGAGGDPQLCKFNEAGDAERPASPAANLTIANATGEAATLMQGAEAYRQQVKLQAEGDAARFLSVYDAYKAAPDVTARRLYIETLEAVLKSTSKIIIDKAATNGVVPYLPLPAVAPTPSGALSGGASPGSAAPPGPAARGGHQ
jgi:membrane protease subunit HflK